MPLIDITRTLNPQIAVWPGDTPFQIARALNLADGASVNLTTLTLSAHTGSHADAPRHFSDAGLALADLPLEPFWGPAQVVTVHKTGPLEPADFAGYDLGRAPRLLVRTPVGALDPMQFPAAYAYPSPALADLLGRLGIVLFGSDCPSMDAVDSTALPGHHALWRAGVAILEGLDLTAAPDGLYELAALPLKIAGGDGSPVRAVLRTVG